MVHLNRQGCVNQGVGAFRRSYCNQGCVNQGVGAFRRSYFDLSMGLGR